VAVVIVIPLMRAATGHVALDRWATSKLAAVRHGGTEQVPGDLGLGCQGPGRLGRGHGEAPAQCPAHAALLIH
jgi:hypothetical protein